MMARSAIPSKRSTSNVALVVLLTFAMISIKEVSALEQDAQIIKPLAAVAKSFIKTVTLGEPLQLNIGPSDIMKGFVSFTWRAKGIPINSLRNFMDKGQDFYNRVRGIVDRTPVDDVKRKSLVNLKVDLDNIVDSIVEEVRSSPDGLFTNYLNTRVNGTSFEDAAIAVGLQLKAYGLDLTNYRNIAGVVLGIPLMPTIASSMVSVAKLGPDLGSLRNMTTDFATRTNFDKLPGAALDIVSQSSNTALNTVNSFRKNIPLVGDLNRPLSTISSRNPFGLISSMPGANQQVLQPTAATAVWS